MKRPYGFDGNPAGEPSDWDPPTPLVEPRPLVEPVEASARDEPTALDMSSSLVEPRPLVEPVEASARDEPTALDELVEASAHNERQPSRWSLAGWRARSVDPVVWARRELRAAQRARKRVERRESRRFSAAARRRRRTWWIALSAVVALVAFVAIGVLTPLTAVREVEVVGTSLVDADALSAELERFEGTSLALVDDGEVHRVLEPFPLIQRYAIERIPPHTLRVRIQERLPVVSIETDDGFELYDAAGVLVGSAAERPAGVPAAAAQVRDPASPAFASAAQVLRELPADLRVQVSEVKATSAQDIQFRFDGFDVIWGEAADTQRKSVVLAAVMSALADRAVEVIDVSSSSAPVFR